MTLFFDEVHNQHAYDDPDGVSSLDNGVFFFPSLAITDKWAAWFCARRNAILICTHRSFFMVEFFDFIAMADTNLMFPTFLPFPFSLTRRAFQVVGFCVSFVSRWLGG